MYNIEDLLLKISELESKVKELENFKAQAPTPIVNPDGTLFFKRHGKEITYNRTSYYINGKAHREDGPAIEYQSGYTEWVLDGLYHRLDGPAIKDGDFQQWWIKSEFIGCSTEGYTQEKFDQYIKLLAFK